MGRNIPDALCQPEASILVEVLLCLLVVLIVCYGRPRWVLHSEWKGFEVDLLKLRTSGDMIELKEIKESSLVNLTSFRPRYLFLTTYYNMLNICIIWRMNIQYVIYTEFLDFYINHKVSKNYKQIFENLTFYSFSTI